MRSTAPSVARSRNPLRSSATVGTATNPTTPSVPPMASTSFSSVVRSRFGFGPCMARKIAIVATRMTVLAIGATATITNRRLANSTAVATVPTA